MERLEVLMCDFVSRALVCCSRVATFKPTQESGLNFSFNFPNKKTKIDSSDNAFTKDGSYNGARVVFLVCGKTQNYAEK